MGCASSKPIDDGATEMKTEDGTQSRQTMFPHVEKAMSHLHQTRLSITGHFNQYESMSAPGEKSLSETRGKGSVQHSDTRVPDIEYAYLTQRGHYPDHPNKANQDAVLVIPKYQGKENQHVFAVLDGHGETGAECAYFCRAKFPLILTQHKNLASNPEKVLSNALMEMNRDLHTSFIDDSLSGTTACVVLMQGHKLVVANVGDSRAVLAKRSFDGSLVAEELTWDQTPFRDDEVERVKKYGARVLTLDQIEGIKDPTVRVWTVESECDGDPPRLWAPEGAYPGTAFTRSIGDSYAETIGVTAEAEVTKVTIEEEDEFMIVATDGVWEFISSQKAVNAVLKQPTLMDAAEFLAAEAYRLWLQNERRTDDISLAIVKFSHKSS